MPSEFYDQLGVDQSASLARIRSAYGQAVSRLARRRKALVDQGGDADRIDLQRAHLDEAWEILSDPLRRRRYDALLKWADSDPRPTDSDEVWGAVADALVHPAAAVAAKLLRVTSRLPEIGDLPLAPSGSADEPPTLVPHDDDLTTPHAAQIGPGSTATESGENTVTERLTRPGPDPDLRVVDGSPGASDVLVMPQRVSIQGLQADQVVEMVDELGYSGALLKAVREELGLSIGDVADHTRISERYLEAVETEARETLPSATFVRGYVREIARMLHLDADTVVSGYMTRLDR